MTFYEVSVGKKIYRVEIEKQGNVPSGAAQDRSEVRDNSNGRWKLRLDGREVAVDIARAGKDVLSLIVNGESFEVRQNRSGESRQIYIRGSAFEVSVRDPRSLHNRKLAGADNAGPQKLIASMPGKVVRVLARAGEKIAADQGIVVVEAMKMQNEVRSPKDGTLKELLVREGANVTAGAVLAIIE
jgi:biotin carboxyl carrier protein